jgi:23S rRNA (adenine-N6)-dimethyltransferase
VVAARRTRAARPTSAATAPNPPGAHALADTAARRLVRAAGITADDLVFDLGAGRGAVTLPLACTGARVIAVERDPRLAARLARRVAGLPNVSVVAGDALTVPLPGRPYRVVANIPFGITTALLRRLLGTRLAGADLVVELGAGRRLAAARPDRAELVRWRARFDIALGPVLPARCFRPPPAVDAVVLRLRRRRQPG